MGSSGERWDGTGVSDLLSYFMYFVPCCLLTNGDCLVVRVGPEE